MAHQFNALVKELKERARVHGMYTEVARRLGVTPQHVRRVAVGITTSKRVIREIEREYKKRKAA